jgi:HEAT repeat protein
MCHFTLRPRLSARWLGPAALAVALCVPAAGVADVPADPVEKLRQALQQNSDSVAESAGKIQDLGDLSRALLLREWRANNLDPNWQRQEQRVWSDLAERFTRAVKDELQDKDSTRRLAAVAFLGNLAVSGRDAGSQDTIQAELLRERMSALAKPLADLIGNDQTPTVRAAALRALGRINPDLRVAVPLLDALLFAMPPGDAASRRAAASALADLLQGGGQLEKKSWMQLIAARQRLRRIERDPTAAPADLKALGDEVQRSRTQQEAVVKGLALFSRQAGRTLADPDAEVRRHGAGAVGEAATLLKNMEVRAPEPDELPGDYRKELAEQGQMLASLAEAVASQVSALADRAVSDTDLDACLAAAGALEEIGEARGHLLDAQAAAFVRPRPVPPPPSPPGMGKDQLEAVPPPASKQSAAPPQLGLDKPLTEALRRAAAPLGKRLSDKDVPLRQRLALLYVLETLEADGAPAAEAVTGRLKDDDPFVRWAAVRALGRMALKGDTADKAVVGLAPLLKDGNADVRNTSAAALAGYGPAARGAAGALAAAVKDKDADADLRALAIGALVAIGADARKEALPALVAALVTEDVSVRRATAHALGQFAPFDPADKDAVEALRKALDDTDLDVRRAASAALLHKNK